MAVEHHELQSENKCVQMMTIPQGAPAGAQADRWMTPWLMSDLETRDLLICTVPKQSVFLSQLAPYWSSEHQGLFRSRIKFTASMPSEPALLRSRRRSRPDLPFSLRKVALQPEHLSHDTASLVTEDDDRSAQLQDNALIAWQQAFRPTAWPGLRRPG